MHASPAVDKARRKKERKQLQQEQEAEAAAAAGAAADAALTQLCGRVLSTFCLLWLCCGYAVPGWPARSLLRAVPCCGLATASWVKGVLSYTMCV